MFFPHLLVIEITEMCLKENQTGWSSKHPRSKQGCSSFLQWPGEDHPEEMPVVRTRVAHSPPPFPSLPQKKGYCFLVFLSPVVYVNPDSTIRFHSTKGEFGCKEVITNSSKVASTGISLTWVPALPFVTRVTWGRWLHLPEPWFSYL